MIKSHVHSSWWPGVILTNHGGLSASPTFYVSIWMGFPRICNWSTATSQQKGGRSDLVETPWLFLHGVCMFSRSLASFHNPHKNMHVRWIENSRLTLAKRVCLHVAQWRDVKGVTLLREASADPSLGTRRAWKRRYWKWMDDFGAVRLPFFWQLQDQNSNLSKAVFFVPDWVSLWNTKSSYFLQWKGGETGCTDALNVVSNENTF